MSTATVAPVRDWETAGPFEFPKRMTSRWICARIGTASGEWYVALCDEMSRKGWGSGNNADIEWFLWGALPQSSRRRVEELQAE